MRAGAAASTHAVAATAASQALLPNDPGDAAGTAIDAVLAGVLALCVRNAGVLLGAGTLLLGGTGEGLVAVDGRARQPGLGAQRPRGFTDPQSIPAAARVAAPMLPHALTLAHAGRGNRTRTALLRYAVEAAKALGPVVDARVEALRAFGREGGHFLHAGEVRDALLEAAARSLGGTLTRDDLGALRPELSPARRVDLDGRLWALAPWSGVLDDAPTAVEPAPGELAIVAAADPYGALAIASVLVPSTALPLGDTGLAAPALAEPVLRGVPRKAAGAALALPAPIGLSQGRGYDGGRSDVGPVDLALGLGGYGDVEALFDELARRVSAAGVALDDALAAPRRGEDSGPRGLASGLWCDTRGRSRPLVDPRPHETTDALRPA